MFLLTVEYVDVNNCEMSSDTRLFASKDNALSCMNEFKENMAQTRKDLSVKEEKHEGGIDFISFSAENKGIEYFDRHISITISEIECEDATPMFTCKDFVKEQIVSIMEAYEINPDEHTNNLIDDLADDILNNEYLWQDFDDNLVTCMRQNPEYLALEESVGN